MIELQLGDGVLMKGFKWHSPNGNVVLTFAGPKAKNAYHLFMWLGVHSDTATATADDRLNTLGWVFDPERAAQAIEARRAETGTGSVHESAVPAGDAPEPLHISSPTPTIEEKST